MNDLKVYETIIDDGDVYKLKVVAKNKNQVKELIRGNGELVSSKDITTDFPISIEKVNQALIDYGFGPHERNIIKLLISNHYSNPTA